MGKKQGPTKPKANENIPLLPLETVIDVFKTKGEEIVKTQMTFGQFLKLERQEGWIYQSYQENFCSLIPTKIIPLK